MHKYTYNTENPKLKTIAVEVTIKFSGNHDLFIPNQALYKNCILRVADYLKYIIEVTSPRQIAQLIKQNKK